MLAVGTDGVVLIFFSVVCHASFLLKINTVSKKQPTNQVSKKRMLYYFLAFR